VLAVGDLCLIVPQNRVAASGYRLSHRVLVCSPRSYSIYGEELKLPKTGVPSLERDLNQRFNSLVI
jgi:hypothetical protein